MDLFIAEQLISAAGLIRFYLFYGSPTAVFFCLFQIRKIRAGSRKKSLPQGRPDFECINSRQSHPSGREEADGSVFDFLSDGFVLYRFRPTLR